MSPNKVYFITGASRGIGLELTKALALTPSNTVIATARNPAKAHALLALATEFSNIKLTTLDVSSQESIDTLNKTLPELCESGIDYYISNAGISNPATVAPVLKVTDRQLWLDHYATNTLGPIFVAQKLYPYLAKRETKVMFIVTSKAGSITQFVPFSSSCYGSTKVATNFSVKQMANELKPENFTVVAVHPGLVLTDMVKAATEGGNKNVPPETIEMMMKKAITPDVSAKLQVELLHKLAKEDTGKFFSYDGSEVAW